VSSDAEVAPVCHPVLSRLTRLIAQTADAISGVYPELGYFTSTVLHKYYFPLPSVVLEC
jgi:hypothetical protein